MNNAAREANMRQTAARAELIASWFQGEQADVATLRERLVADQLTRPGYAGHEADARAYVLNSYTSELDVLCACSSRGISTKK
jgi:hypothetical protein